MPKDLIRYDLLVQSALRGVVRKVLTDVVRDGLPGQHHFYISFRTNEAGTRVSDRLREKYPEEMTIVLQHEFWDLIVNDRGFEVGLSFSKIPERLFVPYDAIMAFFDPSVPFGLKFEVKEETAGAEGKGQAPRALDKTPSNTVAPAGDRPKNEEASPAKSAQKPQREPAKDKKAKPEKAPAPAVPTPEDDKSGAEVVSLDAFRKKH